MNYYLIHLNTRDGEHEYGEQIVTQARDAAEAKKRFKQVYTDPYAENRQWEGDHLDLFDQILEIEYVDEIPEQDYRVLSKYLPRV